MINFRNYIKESWYKTLKASIKIPGIDETFEIFKNPSRKEILSFCDNEIRILLDNKSKSVFIWDGGSAAHFYVCQNIGLRNLYESPDLFAGYGFNYNGKLKMMGDSMYEMLNDYGTVSVVLDQIKSINWKWANKYVINASDHIQYSFINQ